MGENEYDLASLRRLLAAAFSATELPLLTFDLFPQIYDDLILVPHSEKTAHIILYANRHGYIPHLLEYIQKYNPYQYSIWASQAEKNHSLDGTQAQQAAKMIDPGWVKMQIENIHYAFRQADCQEANEIWQNLIMSGATDYITERDRQLVEMLLQMTEGEWLKKEGIATELSFMKRIRREWIPDLAGVLLCTYKNFLPDDSLTLNLLPLHQFPYERLTDVQLSHELWLMRHELGVLSLQDKRLSLNNESDEPTVPFKLPIPLQGQNPLAHRKAEAEQTTLYERGAYWSKRYDENHALHQWLVQIPVNCVIWGESGCGRTALARAMRAMHLQMEQGEINFVVYKAGIPDMTAIQHELASQLLVYICAKPTLLLAYHDALRNMCAEILLQILGSNRVVTALLESRKNKAWLIGATDSQKDAWLEAGQKQLNLMLHSIERVHYDKRQPNLKAWIQNLMPCFQAWGFRGVKLVLDTPINNGAVFESLLRSELFGWKHLGLTVALFVPIDENSLSRKMVHRIISQVDVLPVELSWTVDELRALLTHRFQFIAGIDDPLACFDSVRTYDDFVNTAVRMPKTNTKSEKARLDQIRQWLIKSFDKEELRQLCFDLDVDYDELRGEGKANKAREFVLYLNRRGRITELEKVIINQRPRISQLQKVENSHSQITVVNPQRLVAFWQLCLDELTETERRITTAVVERAKTRLTE